jgi:uncharacterized protein (TIGR00730 family)
MDNAPKPHAHNALEAIARVSWWRELRRFFSFFYEYILGIYRFQRLGPCVTIFGSARFDAEHDYFKIAETLGKLLAQSGYAVMTGGGPGLMEAANKGAQKASGKSYGSAIRIPNEQSANPYMTRCVVFRYFFIRKIMLTRFSLAFIAMPGGFGTLDELFEMLTLIKTEHIKSFPLVLLGCSFWEPLLDYIRAHLVALGTVSQHELEGIYLTDDSADAVRYIHQALGREAHESTTS